MRHLHEASFLFLHEDVVVAVILGLLGSGRGALLAFLLLFVLFVFLLLEPFPGGIAGIAVVLVGLGYLGIKAASEEVGVFQRAHHALGVVAPHVEEGVARQQVYAADVRLLPRDVTVDGLHQVTGEESLALADVHHYAFIPLFGGAAVLVSAFALAPFAAFAALLAVLCVEVDVRHVLVILQQTVELQRKHAFQEILLGEPFQLLAHAGQIFVYLLLVHLHAFQPVGQVVELLLYDVLGGGYGAVLESLPYLLLDTAEVPLFARVDYGY